MDIDFYIGVRTPEECLMDDKGAGGQETEPRWIDEIEREFAESLRVAAWIFQKADNGRFEGSIKACQAVARFILRRNGPAELAGPFLQIAVAFAHLEKGGKPRLFGKKTVPLKERERSPERKHIQKLAAAALDVLMELGDAPGIAAGLVARYVNRWPTMGAQEVKSATVLAWRRQQRERGSNEFKVVVQVMSNAPDPRGVVNDLLRNGPPGMFR
jgi:hypothetical protein